MSARIDAARRLVRKVLRDARDVNKWRKIVRFRLWMPVALQVLLLIAIASYTTARFPGFINATNVTNILILAAPLAVAAMGQTHALLAGYLDLSVGAMVTFGVVIASFLIGPDATASQIALGGGVILLAGLGLGVVNTVLVLGFKIPSIIATLATLSILNGISLTLRETPGGIINRDFTASLGTTLGPLPISFLLVVLAAGALDYWLHASGSGLQLRSTGFDERSAKRSGVRTKWVQGRALVLSALFAAVASFLVMTRSGVGNAAIGDSYVLNSITAAVLGGAALSGGRATFVGTLVASVLLALIISALPFLGLSGEHGLMIIGVLVLLAIVLFQAGDMKELVKRNYKRARRLAIGSRPPKEAEIPDFYPSSTDFGAAPTGRILIRGGTVLSMDPSVGDF
ncbi:MAG TPA: ABC transporter permease, partial [Actinomycetota bacterium]